MVSIPALCGRDHPPAHPRTIESPQRSSAEGSAGVTSTEIAFLHYSLGEEAHQRQHRADRAARRDKMNAVDEFPSPFYSKRLQGRQIAFPIAVANHDGSEAMRVTGDSTRTIATRSFHARLSAGHFRLPASAIDAPDRLAVLCRVSGDIEIHRLARFARKL
jgi:hypothetical protein